MPNAQTRVLKANTAEWRQWPELEEEQPPQLPKFFRTPKGQVLVVFVLLLCIAAPGESSMLAALGNVAVAIAAACAVDVVYTYWESRRWLLPTSALLSGMIVAFVLGAQEPWQVAAWVAGFASVSKHVIADKRGHFFNPAALALVGSVLLFGSGQSWWGALGDVPAPWIVVLLATGLFVVDRLNKFPLILTFLGTYFAIFALVSMVDASTVAEMFRSPFVQSALFLAFFMLTDPPTSPNRVGEQVWFGIIAAVVACLSQLLGAGQIYLLIGVLVANAWLALRRWAARRPPAETPVQRRKARIQAMQARRASANVR